jgi:hypothetical protein
MAAHHPDKPETRADWEESWRRDAEIGADRAVATVGRDARAAAAYKERFAAVRTKIEKI